MKTELEKWIEGIEKYSPEIIDKLMEFFTKLALGEGSLGLELSTHQRMLVESQLSIPKAFSSRLKIDPNELVGFFRLLAENANTIAAICRFTDNNDTFVKLPTMKEKSASEDLPVAIVEAAGSGSAYVASGEKDKRTLIGMLPVAEVQTKDGKEVLPVAQAVLVEEPALDASAAASDVSKDLEARSDSRTESKMFDPHNCQWLETFDSKQWFSQLTPRLQLALMMYYAGFGQSWVLEPLYEKINKEPFPFSLTSARTITLLIKEPKIVNKDLLFFRPVGESRGVKYTSYLLTERAIEECRKAIDNKVEDLLEE